MRKQKLMKRSTNQAGVAYMLDYCHLCEYYIIMYAYTIITIYVYTDIW